MVRTRVFVTSSQIQGDRARIIGEDVHHLGQVLRKQVKDSLLVTTDGKTYLGMIQQVSQDEILVELGVQIKDSVESPIFIRLYQGMPKSNKIELVIQKTVELGVSEIIPFYSRHTVVKLTKEKQNQRLTRWKRIAVEAGKQCGRERVPEIKPPLSFTELVRDLKNRSNNHLVLMPYEKSTLTGFKQLELLKPAEISVIIGPEGGFAEEEVGQVKQFGGKIMHLGPRILRTETAAIASLALVQFIWGDLS